MNTKRTKKLLSAEEVESLKNRIAERKQDSVETAEFYSSPQSDTEEANIRKMQRILDEGSPEEATKNKRARLESEWRELGGRISSMMVSRELMQSRSGSNDYHRAVRGLVEVEGSAEFQALTQQWKNLGRQIDPLNPELTDLDSLRK